MNAQLQAQPGRVIYDEPAEVYYRRSLGEANNTGLKILNSQSAAHFKYWVEEPDADRTTPTLEFGRAYHCATLEPDVFDATYSIVPKDAPERPTEAMLKAYAKGTSRDSSIYRIEWWQAWEAENAGRILLKNKDYDRVRGMAESVRAHPLASAMLQGGRREVTLRWIDPQTGLPCKARVDLYDQEMGYLLDLKSCVSAHPDDMGRAVPRFYYHQQHAHYCEGARACELPFDHFLLLAVESQPPYVCAPYTIDSHMEARGYELRDRGLALQAKCLRENRWPGYGDGQITELTAPYWALTD